MGKDITYRASKFHYGGDKIIAIQETNVKRVFVYAARQSIFNHHNKISGKTMEET